MKNDINQELKWKYNFFLNFKIEDFTKNENNKLDFFNDEPIPIINIKMKNSPILKRIEK